MTAKEKSRQMCVASIASIQQFAPLLSMEQAQKLLDQVYENIYRMHPTQEQKDEFPKMWAEAQKLTASVRLN